MAIPRIRHLAIRCRDVDRTVAFYRDGLGFQVIGQRGRGWDLSDQTLNLTLLPFEGDPPPASAEGLEQIHFGVYVPDARALFVKLRDLGALSVRHDIKARNAPEPDRIPQGSYKVVDPEGNVIDVTDDEAEWRGVSQVR
jgi:catechol 2,3-dioxygenase-like lactoylglutathione lyase family enzyme